MVIIVDAMGGDNAPEAIINGCIGAVKEADGFDILLVGDSNRIKEVLSEKKYDENRIKVKHTSEIIHGDDSPTRVIKEKKDSSMVIGFKMLKEKIGDVFISAGNTGALLSGALFILGRVKGVDRPALAPIIPTKSGGAMLIDAGLNTNCKPVNYLQFGIIGSIYMNRVFNIENPRVGLLNNGTEETKGTEVVKQAFTRLSSSKLNFIGNIEGRQLPEGSVDVAVCDGFVGNILLKFLEGVGSFIFGGLKKVYSKNFISQLSALAVNKDLRKFKKGLDYEEYGGTPILGVNGMVFKCHGSSNAKTIKNAVKRAYNFAKTNVLELIKDEFKNMEDENIE